MERLKGVHVSSLANKVIKTISFVLRKIFVSQKQVTRKTQLTKQNQANKKQQRQQFFVPKNFYEGENCLFCV